MIRLPKLPHSGGATRLAFMFIGKIMRSGSADAIARVDYRSQSSSAEVVQIKSSQGVRRIYFSMITNAGAANHPSCVINCDA